MQKKSAKKIIAAAAAVILISGGAGAFYMTNRAYAIDGSQPSYREYTVSKGNITVGAEESGTLSIERSYITFPCSAEVMEVYVKEGVTVKEGDPLLKLSFDDIEDARTELLSSVTSAQLALEQAETNRESRLLEARQTLERSLAEGENAGSEYSLFIEKNNASKETSAKQLEDLKKDLEEYEALSRTYPDAYAKLTAYENRLDEYDSEYKKMESEYRALRKTDTANAEKTEALQDEYDEYIKSISDKAENISKLKSRYETAKEKYEKAIDEYETAKENYDNSLANASAYSADNSSSDTASAPSGANSSENSGSSTANTSSALKTVTENAKKRSDAEKAMNEAFSEYNSARVAYAGYYQALGEKISDKTEEYEDSIEKLKKIQKSHEKETNAYKEKMDDLNNEISDYRSEYEKYRSDFTDVYGQNDAESIADKISSLKESISKSELDIKSDASDESGKILSARQQQQSAQAGAQNAQAVYDQTAAALDSEVEKAQRTYDSAVKKYDKFMESISGDGVVYADCSGIVSNVSASEGSSVQANMTLITLMDTRYIYLSASVSEEDITSLYTGQECSVSLTAYENKSFSGKVDTISAEPARSSGSVTYTVKVKLDDESGLNVREGMSGEINFLSKQVSGVLYVNVNAVKFRDGASYVRVYDENGSVAEKQITTGFTDGRNVEVSGLSAGDKVLAEIDLGGGKNNQSRSK